MHDANTVRRIVAAADLRSTDHVLEVGPGLGSLTLGLLDAAAAVTAVEIDPRLAALLPRTVAEHAPAARPALQVITADALEVTADRLVTSEDIAAPPDPTALVANLPYNVAVPVLLHLLAEVPTLRSVLVMVQAEVADRLVAPARAPGRTASPSVEDRLVRDGAPGRVGAAHGVLAGARGRLGAGRDPAARPRPDGRPGRGVRRHRRRIRAAPQDAAGRARRTGPAPRPTPSRCWAEPGSTRPPAARCSVSTTSSRIAAALDDLDAATHE